MLNGSFYSLTQQTKAVAYTYAETVLALPKLSIKIIWLRWKKCLWCKISTGGLLNGGSTVSLPKAGVWGRQGRTRNFFDAVSLLMFFIQLRKYTFYGLGKLSACLNLLLHKKMEGKEYSNNFAISSLNQKRIHFSWPRVNSFRTTCRLTWFSIGLHCFNVGNTHRSNTKKYQEQYNQKVKRIHFKYQSNFYSY